MELKVKILNWSAGIPVAMLNESTANLIGVKTNGRISVKTISKNPDSVSTIVDIAKTLVGKKQIAVSTELKERLSLKNGQKVDVDLSINPRSLTFIKNKMNGKRLSQKEISEIIYDITRNSLSDAEIALFISAMYDKGMNMQETIYLINAISNSGQKLKWKGKLIADKHSIGGIPGNRTTPLVVAICAAGGLIMPKSSSRAITTAAGTAEPASSCLPYSYLYCPPYRLIRRCCLSLFLGRAVSTWLFIITNVFSKTRAYPDITNLPIKYINSSQDQGIACQGLAFLLWGFPVDQIDLALVHFGQDQSDFKIFLKKIEGEFR